MAVRRWSEILDELKAGIEAGTLKPGDRLPSDAELAAQKQVSNATVHRAMQEALRLGLITRKPRVGTMVAAPAAPSPLRIGLISIHSGTPLLGGYLSGILSVIPDDCRKLMEEAFDVSGGEAEAIRRVGKEVDGIIIYPSGLPDTEAAFTEIAERGVPIVCLDCLPVWAVTDAVVTANYEGMFQAVGRLIDRGHRAIAYLTFDHLHVSAIRERYEGYRDALRSALPDAQEQVIWLHERPGLSYWDSLAELARLRVSELLAGDAPPTAIACEHEWYLPAVLQVIDELGRRVPDDLEVLSFNDRPLWYFSDGKRCHRLVQRAEAMGRRAAQLLLDRIAGHDGPPVIERVPADYYPPGSLR